MGFLNDHFDKFRSTHQHGFVKFRSTTTNLLDTYNTLFSNLNKKMPTDLIFFDMSKAFDKINHTTLIKKMKAYKFPHILIKLVARLLYHRKQYVCYDGFCSSYKKVSSGVPQGSVLGPILFLIYINDFLKSPLKSHVSAFADDLKMLSENSSHLQEDINIFENWCNLNFIEINRDKSGVIYFGKKMNDESTFCQVES